MIAMNKSMQILKMNADFGLLNRIVECLKDFKDNRQPRLYRCACAAGSHDAATALCLVIASEAKQSINCIAGRSLRPLRKIFAPLREPALFRTLASLRRLKPTVNKKQSKN